MTILTAITNARSQAKGGRGAGNGGLKPRFMANKKH